MQFVLLFLLLSWCYLCTAQNPYSSDPRHADFLAWKAKYNKTYANDEEHFHRFEIWKDNSDKIDSINALRDRTFTVAMNLFGDLTLQEFANTYLGLKVPDNIRSKLKREAERGTFCISSCQSYETEYGYGLTANNITKWIEYVTPPSFVDGGKQDPAGQGSCGSCWAFAATRCIEAYMNMKNGNYAASGVHLSVQNLIDCSTPEGTMGCWGGWMNQAFQYVMDNGGIATHSSYLYQDFNWNPASPNTYPCRYDSSECGANVLDFYRLPHEEQALQNHLLQTGPAVVAIDAAHTSFQFYSGGVYNEPECSQTEMNHGILLIGVGKPIIYGQDAWLLQNSWGPYWGVEIGLEGGYMFMQLGCNMCGITNAASYPDVASCTAKRTKKEPPIKAKKEIHELGKRGQSWSTFYDGQMTSNVLGSITDLPLSVLDPTDKVFSQPFTTGIAISPAGTLFLSDPANAYVWRFEKEQWQGPKNLLWKPESVYFAYYNPQNIAGIQNVISVLSELDGIFLDQNDVLWVTGIVNLYPGQIVGFTNASTRPTGNWSATTDMYLRPPGAYSNIRSLSVHGDGYQYLFATYKVCLEYSPGAQPQILLFDLSTMQVVGGLGTLCADVRNSSCMVKPNDVHYDPESGRLYATDSVRVLVWKDAINKAMSIGVMNANNLNGVWNTAPADIVIGQADFTSSVFGCAPNLYKTIEGVLLAGKTLFVTDTDNDRILVYNNVALLPSTGASADLVLYKPNMWTCGDPFGLIFDVPLTPYLMAYYPDGNQLLVTDRLGQVLVFTGIVTQGALNCHGGQWSNTDFCDCSTPQVATCWWGAPQLLDCSCDCNAITCGDSKVKDHATGYVHRDDCSCTCIRSCLGGATMIAGCQCNCQSLPPCQSDRPRFPDCACDCSDVICAPNEAMQDDCSCSAIPTPPLAETPLPQVDTSTPLPEADTSTPLPEEGTLVSVESQGCTDWGCYLAILMQWYPYITGLFGRALYWL